MADNPYLLIDIPVEITDQAKPNTLTLKKITPHRFVASARWLLVVNGYIPTQGEVWEYEVGWLFKSGEVWSEKHHSPYVLPQNQGKAHSLLTLYDKIVTLKDWQYWGDNYDGTPLVKLSDYLKYTPRFDNPGGYRGANNNYPRGVKVGELWLTQEAADKLTQVLGEHPAKKARMNYLSKLIMEDQ